MVLSPEKQKPVDRPISLLLCSFRFRTPCTPLFVSFSRSLYSFVRFVFALPVPPAAVATRATCAIATRLSAFSMVSTPPQPRAPPAQLPHARPPLAWFPRRRSHARHLRNCHMPERRVYYPARLRESPLGPFLIPPVPACGCCHPGGRHVLPGSCQPVASQLPAQLPDRW
jgi:hypothetical protein